MHFQGELLACTCFYWKGIDCFIRRRRDVNLECLILSRTRTDTLHFFKYVNLSLYIAFFHLHHIYFLCLLFSIEKNTWHIIQYCAKVLVQVATIITINVTFFPLTFFYFGLLKLVDTLLCLKFKTMCIYYLFNESLE